MAARPCWQRTLAQPRSAGALAGGMVDTESCECARSSVGWRLRRVAVYVDAVMGEQRARSGAALANAAVRGCIAGGGPAARGAGWPQPGPGLLAEAGRLAGLDGAGAPGALACVGSFGGDHGGPCLADAAVGAPRDLVLLYLHGLAPLDAGASGGRAGLSDRGRLLATPA